MLKDASVADEWLVPLHINISHLGHPVRIGGSGDTAVYYMSSPPCPGRQNLTNKQVAVRQCPYYGVFVVCTLLAKKSFLFNRGKNITAHLSSENPTHIKKEEAWIIKQSPWVAIAKICVSRHYSALPQLSILALVMSVSQQIWVSYRNYAVLQPAYVHSARMHGRKIMTCRL